MNTATSSSHLVCRLLTRLQAAREARGNNLVEAPLGLSSHLTAIQGYEWSPFSVR